jgi:hypothetical protein
MALELPEDQLLTATFTAARLLARQTVEALPAPGKAAMRRQLARPDARLIVVLDLGKGTGEVAALADGAQPLRAPLRR